MNLREGYSYKDREGTIWNCYQYDGDWSWCRNTKDDAPGLFTFDGRYTTTNEMPFDLIEDLGPTTPEDEAEMRMNEWYENRGYLVDPND